MSSSDGMEGCGGGAAAAITKTQAQTHPKSDARTHGDCDPMGRWAGSRARSLINSDLFAGVYEPFVDGHGPVVQTFSSQPLALKYDSRAMNERMSADPSSHPQVQLLPWYLSGTLNSVETRQVTAHLGQCELCRAELESLTLMRRIVRQSFADPGAGMPRRTVAAVGVVLASVIAVQLAVIIRLWPTSPINGAPPTPVPPRVGTSLRLLPNPNASTGLLEEFLQRLQARIVDGPDSDGSYVVVIPTTDPGRVAETVAVLQSRPEVVVRAATVK
jgi:hypothetical protein